MKALSFTTARKQQQQQQQQQRGRRSASPSGTTTASASPAPPDAAQQPDDPSAALANGGREALSTVAGFIALPWTRESAKRKLRTELRGELGGIWEGGCNIGIGCLPKVHEVP